MKSQANTILVAVFLSGWGAWAVSNLPDWLNNAPPVSFHSSEFDRDTYAPGEQARINIDRTMHTFCPTAEVREWWRSPTDEYIHGDLRPVAGRPTTGRRQFQITKRIPHFLSDGKWCYAPTVTYHCESGDYTVKQVEACFTVQSK